MPLNRGMKPQAVPRWVWWSVRLRLRPWAWSSFLTRLVLECRYDDWICLWRLIPIKSNEWIVCVLVLYRLLQINQDCCLVIISWLIEFRFLSWDCGCIPRRGFHRLVSSRMMLSIHLVRDDASTPGGSRKSSFQYSVFTHMFVYIALMLIQVDSGFKMSKTIK